MSSRRSKKKKPEFKAKRGQIDFTHTRFAPVINCVVKYKNKILIVERSKKLNFYPVFWNGISGFLDDRRTLREKVIDELKEEIGLSKKAIKKIHFGEIFHQEEPKYKKTWIVHPVLVEVATDKITLNWEAGDYRWLTLKEAKKLKLLPGFDVVLKKLRMLLSRV